MQAKTVATLKTILILISFFVLCGFDGCNGPPPNESGGFPVTSYENDELFGQLISSEPHPGASVTGSWAADASSSANGYIYQFSVSTDAIGYGPDFTIASFVDI